MHVRELVELGAQIAIFSSRRSSGGRGMQTYWSASKCRTQRWVLAIRRQGELIALGRTNSRDVWARFVPLFQEVLASELLTRVVAAAAAAHDAREKVAEFEPVAQSIFSGHLEARNKVLQLLLTGERQGVAQAKQLNDLRRRIERWTDMLLARFLPLAGVSDFAFEPNRMRDFADDLAESGLDRENELTGKLVLSSLRGSLLSQLTGPTLNSDLNAKIAESAKETFLGASSDSPLETGWLSRISRMADDAQSLLDEIAALDPA